MTRLPEVFGDTDKWGTILQQFLLVAHNEDGTLKSTIISGLLANGVLYANVAGTLSQELAFTYNESTDTLHVINLSATGQISVTNLSTGNVTITGGVITGITDLTVADGGTGASTAANARTNLGLGTMAVQAAAAVAITGGVITGITDITVADGGTGASTAAGARTNLGAAPLDPTFVTLGTNSELTNERVLTAGLNVTLTDAGAGGTLTIAALETGTWSVVTGSRAIGTIYQNTSGKKRRVLASIRLQAAQSKIYVENANPPTVVIGEGDSGAAIDITIPFFFEVPSGQFYKITQDVGTVSNVRWSEIDE